MVLAEEIPGNEVAAGFQDSGEIKPRPGLASPEEACQERDSMRFVPTHSFLELSEAKEQLLKEVFRKDAILKKELNKLCDVILALKREESTFRRSRVLPLCEIRLDKTRHQLKAVKKLMALLENECLENPKFRNLSEDIKNVDLYLWMISKENLLKRSSEQDNKRYSHLQNEK